MIELVHAAFTVLTLDDETPNEEIKCILNFDKSKVPVTSKLISVVGKGSVIYARRFFQKLDEHV